MGIKFERELNGLQEIEFTLRNLDQQQNLKQLRNSTEENSIEQLQNHN